MDLEPPGRDARAHPRYSLGPRAHALCKGGIDLRRLARLRTRTRLLRGAFGLAHGEPVAEDALRELPAAGVIGDCEHRARMTFRQLAPHEHPQHLVGQL